MTWVIRERSSKDSPNPHYQERGNAFTTNLQDALIYTDRDMAEVTAMLMPIAVDVVPVVSKERLVVDENPYSRANRQPRRDGKIAD